MRRWCACLAAAVLSLSREGARADPSPALEVDAAAARFAQALADVGWRRDDPRVRAVADEVTGELLARLDAPGEAHAEARALAREAAGEGLGGWLQRPEHTGDPLVGAWLREHDDCTLDATIGAREDVVHVAAEVVTRRPEAAAPWIAASFSTVGAGAGGCAVALALPVTMRRTLATTTWQATGALQSPECVALIASSPSLRAELARDAAAELQRHAGVTTGAFGAEVPVWAVVAGMLTVATATPAQVTSLRATLDRYAADPLSPAFAAALARVGPWLPYDAPSLAPLLARLDGHVAGTPTSLAAVRLRVRDAARRTWIARAVTRLEWITADRDGLVAEYARGTPRGREADAVDVLTRVYARLRGADARRRSLDNWIEALQRTAACTDDACLVDVVTHGSDEAAARAAWLLGAARLDDAPVASALVARLAMERPSIPSTVAPWDEDDGHALATVVFATVEGCPDTLRPLARMPLAVPWVLRTAVAPWVTAFIARCHESPARERSR